MKYIILIIALYAFACKKKNLYIGGWSIKEIKYKQEDFFHYMAINFIEIKEKNVLELPGGRNVFKGVSYYWEERHGTWSYDKKKDSLIFSVDNNPLSGAYKIKNVTYYNQKKNEIEFIELENNNFKILLKDGDVFYDR